MCQRKRERERERERVRGPHLDREKVASQDRIVYCGFSEVPVVHGRGVCTRFHQNSDDARVTRPCRSADERSLEDVPRVDVKGPRSAALSREERPGEWWRVIVVSRAKRSQPVAGLSPQRALVPRLHRGLQVGLQVHDCVSALDIFG